MLINAPLWILTRCCHGNLTCDQRTAVWFYQWNNGLFYSNAAKVLPVKMSSVTLFVIWVMTVAFSAYVTIKLWDLGLCAWSHCINRKALIIQPWGRQQSSMEETRLPISFVWGLFLIKSIDRLQLHSSTLFYVCQKALPGRKLELSSTNRFLGKMLNPKTRVYEDWGYSILCFHVNHVTSSPLCYFQRREKWEMRRDEDGEAKTFCQMKIICSHPSALHTSVPYSMLHSCGNKQTGSDKALI